jgi:hypothetical protein
MIHCTRADSYRLRPRLFAGQVANEDHYSITVGLKNKNEVSHSLRIFILQVPPHPERSRRVGAEGVLHGRQLYFLLQFQNTFFEQAVGIHQVLYRLATVDHRSMVAAAEMFANGLE